MLKEKYLFLSYKYTHIYSISDMRPNIKEQGMSFYLDAISNKSSEENIVNTYYHNKETRLLHKVTNSYLDILSQQKSTDGLRFKG